MIGVAESVNWKRGSSDVLFFFMREPGVVPLEPSFPQNPLAHSPIVREAAFDSVALVPHRS